MAFTVDHAKRMRAAYRNAPKLTVQVGHQSCSSGQMPDAAQLPGHGYVGKVTALHMHMYRNTPHGKPQWARPVYPDMNPENVLWNSFLGEAPKREFEANRYINWRFFWDYSGGNVYENMCHQLSFWYKALNLQIPKAVTMTGGIYLWKDGREVPDTMNVSIEQPEDILISWDSGFGNNQLSVTEDVLGTDGTISKGPSIRYVPQKVNRPDGTEMLGRTTARRQRAHAELSGLHPGRQRTELPFRFGIPGVDRLPDGSGKLSPGPQHALGPAERSDRLIRDGIRLHSGADPSSQNRPRIRRSGDRAARPRVG